MDIFKCAIFVANIPKIHILQTLNHNWMYDGAILFSPLKGWAILKACIFHFTFLTDWICRRSELRDHGEDLPLLASPKGIKAVIMSIGRGKIIVEFFSALMLLSVCKYLNWNKNKVKQKQSRGIGRCTAYHPLKQNGPWMPSPWRKGIPKGPGIQAKGKWIK